MLKIVLLSLLGVIFFLKKDVVEDKGDANEKVVEGNKEGEPSEEVVEDK